MKIFKSQWIVFWNKEYVVAVTKLCLCVF